MKERKQKTVAELMDPQDGQNTVDLSGLGVDWRPEEVLAAAEMQWFPAINLTKTERKDETE